MPNLLRSNPPIRKLGGTSRNGARMRTWLAIIVILLAAGLPLRAADLKPPDWLPRYDLAINLDVCGHQAHVTQQVSWVNRSDKPVGELIFNIHSRFTPPQTREQVNQFARLLEIFRMPANDAIFLHRAFQLEKVERLTAVGKDWKREELKTLWHKDLATALIVPLPEPVAPGGTVAVALSYTMELPQKQGRWGQWKGVTTLSNWHPVLAVHDLEKGWQPTPFIPWGQPWFNEAGVYNARVRLPKDQQVACTGSIAKVVEGDETKEVTIGPVVARDFALLTSARYHEFTGNAGPVKVKCIAFPEHEHHARVLIQHASKAIEAFSKWLGAFPYPEFTIAESYFGWNGNECGGLVMIDERVFSMPHLADGYIEYLISHETCHQWFYNAVGTNGYKETFMDEAIVTYLSHRLLHQLNGKNNDLLHYPPELAFLPGIGEDNYRYSSFYTILKNGNLQPAVQDLEKYGSVIGMFAAVYDRGSKIVGIVEDRLGPTAFLEFMRRIYSKYYFRIITVADFQRELEEYTGRKWDRFFQEWLTTSGVSDWAVDGVEVGGACPPEGAAPAGGFTATVTLSQRAKISEETTLGFSFDGGATYSVRVPIKVPAKDDVPNPNSPVVCERIDDTHFRVRVNLPSAPDQVAVDPDQVLPDADPVNNFWKVPIRYRPRPLYTAFLDETNFTNDYDKWNVIYGPWIYSPPYSEAWFTRATVLGARAGVFRTEEFRGGVYAGYRPPFGDMAVGFDAHVAHWPGPKWEVGVHGEKSVGQFLQHDNYNPDRAIAWVRHNIEPTASLYLPPREFAEAYAAYQHNWMPNPRYPRPDAVGIDPLTTVGLHYHKDTQIPYWDPDNGWRVDGNVAAGAPLFGEGRWSGLAWGQVSWVTGLPGELGWWSDVKLALRAGGGIALPRNGRLYTLGGNELFRGFDVFERQGNCMWVGSVEVRIPIKREIDYDFADHIIRLRSFSIAPFYDVGDMYQNGHSLGAVAHAVGIGFRLQVDFFSFLERGTVRFDIAQAIGFNTAPQFWFGFQQPF
jgi:Peptidase family M1 domain